jgi:DNA polymerase-3 subunit beta
MKLQINRDHFSSALQLVSSVVGTRKTMPILQNVLLEAKGEALHLTTTNLDLGIRCAVKANVESEGTVTLPVKDLARIVRELADIEVNLDTSGGTKATITTRGSVFNVVGMDSKEFPPLPELAESREFAISRTKLSSMLKSISYAQSINEERYMLKGVFFQLSENELSLVATDGRRLAVTSEKSSNFDGLTGEFILPSMTVAELEKLPKIGDQIGVTFTDRQAAFHMQVSGDQEENLGYVDSIQLVSKVVEGKYPNFKQVIPKDDFNEAIIERELMQECVHRAALVSEEKVTLRIKPGEMEITGQSVMGDACESMNIDYSGQDSIVSFNPRFLLDPLKSLTLDKVVFEFRDDMSPGVFKVNPSKEESVNFLCVVMPIRTD